MRDDPFSDLGATWSGSCLLARNARAKRNEVPVLGVCTHAIRSSPCQAHAYQPASQPRFGCLQHSFAGLPPALPTQACVAVVFGSRHLLIADGRPFWQSHLANGFGGCSAAVGHSSRPPCKFMPGKPHSTVLPPRLKAPRQPCSTQTLDSLQPNVAFTTHSVFELYWRTSLQ